MEETTIPFLFVPHLALGLEWYHQPLMLLQMLGKRIELDLLIILPSSIHKKTLPSCARDIRDGGGVGRGP